MQMFLMPQELESLVRPLLQKDRLWLVADGSAENGPIWLPGRAPQKMPKIVQGFRGHILVCTDQPPSAAGDRMAGRCVRLEIPTIRNGALQLVQHDTRTDRQDILRIADRLFRHMRTATSRPVWAWRSDDTTTARAYRDISITPGAEAWWRSGRALRQLGSDFIDFAPEPPNG